jgi:hypothetical protein
MDTNDKIIMFCFMFIVTVFIVYNTLFYKYIYLPKQTSKMHFVYEKLYKHIKSKNTITSLCKEIKMYLSIEEQNIIYKHFYSQKPSSKINKDFFNNKCFIGGIYWWHYNSLNKEINYESTKQRKLFIFKMIKITTKK